MNFDHLLGLGLFIFYGSLFGWATFYIMSLFAYAEDPLWNFKERSERKRKKIFEFLNQKEQQEYLDLEKALLEYQKQYRYEGRKDFSTLGTRDIRKRDRNKIEGLECLSHDRKKKIIEFNPV